MGVIKIDSLHLLQCRHREDLGRFTKSHNEVRQVCLKNILILFSFCFIKYTVPSILFEASHYVSCDSIFNSSLKGHHTPL